MRGELPPHYGQRALRALFGDRPLPPAAHTGLVFDRYLPIWRGDRLLRELRKEGRGDDRGDEQKEALEDFCRATAQPGPAQRDLLATVNERLDRALAGLAGVHSFVLRTGARLAVGTGAKHPLENGLTFDPVVGVPFLPGSSLKGLCRTWARVLRSEDGLSEERVRELLGPDGEEETKTAGDLVFWPAWPRPGAKEWPSLEVDVINSHHREYYTGNRERAVDWESPVPVYFLAVKAGTSFCFRLSSRSGGKENTAEGRRLLTEALQVLGLGGKTAVGYGVFEREPGGRVAQAGAAPRSVPPARVEESTATVLLRKNDGSLQAQLADRAVIVTRGEQARALRASLPAEIQERMAKGREVRLKVRYSSDGNERQIVALVPL